MLLRIAEADGVREGIDHKTLFKTQKKAVVFDLLHIRRQFDHGQGSGEQKRFGLDPFQAERQFDVAELAV